MFQFSPIRIFRCHECGHRMRLSGGLCGVCHADKPGWMRPDTVLGAMAMGALGLACLALLLVLI